MPTPTPREELQALLKKAAVLELQILKAAQDPQSNIGQRVAWQNEYDWAITDAIALIGIDQEFKALLLPLQPHERENLKTSILEDGIRDALILGETPTGHLVLIDGHNRLEIAKEEGLYFDIEVKTFDTRDQVKTWMILNQLSRRNLTDEQRAYFIGMRYEAEKGQHGGARRGPEMPAGAKSLSETYDTGGYRKPKDSRAQNEPLKGSAAQRVAAEQGVSPAQVKRDHAFAKAVTQLGEQNPDAQAKILAGQHQVTKQEIARLADAPPEQLQLVANAIADEKPLIAGLPWDQLENSNLTVYGNALLYLEHMAKLKPADLLQAFERIFDLNPAAVNEGFKRLGNQLHPDNQKYVASLLLGHASLSNNVSVDQLIPFQEAKNWLDRVAENDPPSFARALYRVLEEKNLPELYTWAKEAHADLMMPAYHEELQPHYDKLKASSDLNLDQLEQQFNAYEQDFEQSSRIDDEPEADRDDLTLSDEAAVVEPQPLVFATEAELDAYLKKRKTDRTRQFLNSSESDDWATPMNLFTVLTKEFNFILDVCADAENTKARVFFTKGDDGLAQDWARTAQSLQESLAEPTGAIWMNPPYGSGISNWLEKAFFTAALGKITVVCLVPANTESSWWWEWCSLAETRLLPGRLKYGLVPGNPAGFGSAVVIFPANIADGKFKPSITLWDYEGKYEKGPFWSPNEASNYISAGTSFRVHNTFFHHTHDYNQRGSGITPSEVYKRGLFIKSGRRK